MLLIVNYITKFLYLTGTPFATPTDVTNGIRDSPIHWNARGNLKQKKKYVTDKLL